MNTLLKMMNITVAITVAAVVLKAARKARMEVAKDAHRLYTLTGMKKIERKERQIPIRNKTNM